MARIASHKQVAMAIYRTLVQTPSHRGNATTICKFPFISGAIAVTGTISTAAITVTTSRITIIVPRPFTCAGVSFLLT